MTMLIRKKRQEKIKERDEYTLTLKFMLIDALSVHCYVSCTPFHIPTAEEHRECF